MSVPADYMQNLMGGLLNYSQPSVTSGLLGGNDPTMNLGLQLLANSNSGGHFGQILGQSALQAQQQGRQNQLQNLQLAQGLQSLAFTAQKNQALMDALGPTGGSPPSAAPPPGDQPPPQQFLPGISQMPAQQPTAQQASMPQQVAAQSFDANTDISQIPIGGVPPAVARKVALLSGKDPAQTEKEIHERQLQTYQEAVAPQISALDTVVKSGSPAQFVQADPKLQQIWAQIAPKLGYNPVRDFNDQTVRTALTFARNQISSRAQLPNETPIVPVQQVRLPDGRVAQVDTLTGKQTIEAPSSLVKVVGKDGKPVLVPEAKAVGMRPYNEMTAASDEALQSTAEDVANYKIAPPSGSKLLSGNWPEVMHLVKSINPDYDATQFSTKNKARQAFATGKQGDIVRSLSVATDHLDQLSQAADALKNKDTQVVNRVVNFFGQQAGHPEVTSFNAMKEIVGDEVVKAVVGNTGAAGDREAIKKTFSDANSPAQLQSVIQKYKGLMGGQLKGLRQQYERTTGLKDFDAAISDNAKAELTPTPGAAAATAPSPGWGKVVVHP